MRDYEELDSGLYVPPLRIDIQAQMERMVSSPMMQYLTMATFSEWASGEGNWETTWNLPVYSQLAMIQDVTTTGIDLIVQCNDLQQSKSWAMTSMMARGASLARMSCLALATGSLSDAFSGYRMLLDRLITLRYLEDNNQYEAFAKFSYADLYHRINSRLDDGELRESYTSGEIKQYKEMMALIRKKFFPDSHPRKPQHYWKPPYTKDLVASALANDGGLQQKQTSQVYELGNRSVHPWIRDLIQPEDSDITPQEFMRLILITAADLSVFGLSLHSATAPLADEVKRIALDTPQQGIPIWTLVANTHIRIDQLLATRIHSPDDPET